MKILFLNVFSPAIMLFFLCFSFYQTTNSQNITRGDLKRYSDPSEIDPMKLNFNEFLAEDTEALKYAADMSFQKGDYLEAARVYLYIVNRNTDDADSYYRLAECYSELNMPEYAINFLVLSVNAGYSDYERIKSDERLKELEMNNSTKARFNELVQYGNKYGESKYFRVTKLERCLLFLPEDYDANKEYPLIIGLHGNGSNPFLFSDLWKYIKDEEVIYAVPQSPYNYSTRGGIKTQRYSWGIISLNKELWELADPLVFDYFINIRDGLSGEYNISSTILFGFSQGAGFAYAAGIKHNDVFDGIICFGGRLSEPEQYPWFLNSDDLEKNNDLKIFIAHGTNDEAIDSSAARQSNRLLRRYGYDTQLEIFEGGHYVPGAILKKAVSWILQGDEETERLRD